MEDPGVENVGRLFREAIGYPADAIAFRKSDAITRAIAEMDVRAKASVAAVIGAIADQMRMTPWRLNFAVTGERSWPPNRGTTLGDMLQTVHLRIDVMRQKARAGILPDLIVLENLLAAEDVLIDWLAAE